MAMRSWFTSTTVTPSPRLTVSAKSRGAPACTVGPGTRRGTKWNRGVARRSRSFSVRSGPDQQDSRSSANRGRRSAMTGMQHASVPPAAGRLARQRSVARQRVMALSCFLVTMRFLERPTYVSYVSEVMCQPMNYTGRQRIANTFYAADAEYRHVHFTWPG